MVDNDEKTKELAKKLNLSYLNVSNQTYSCGKYDMPYLTYEKEIYPDYVALYSEKRNYSKTDRTFISFYQFDSVFDGPKGLYNSIYYNDVTRLKEYKERFKDVFGAISPDYSQVMDIHFAENMYRCFKSRIVANWLIVECGLVVIPNIAYIDQRSKEYCFDGIQKNSIVAISTKGCMMGNKGKKIIMDTVKATVDNIHPKGIVVYRVNVDDTEVRELFKYALDNGVDIIMPSNILFERNKIKKESKKDGQNL